MLTISPTSAAIKRYYEELAQYDAFDAQHELARKTAFQSLLQAVASQVGWMLIPEEPLANGKWPDGTLRDEFHLPRGYWEAKDPHDDLATEIRKKIALGYPTLNTIFEDTRHATLYQNRRVALEADLTKAREHGRISRGDVVDLCHIGETQATRLLDRLLERGALDRHGAGRGTYYTPHDPSQ